PVKSFLDELTDEEVAAVVAGMKEIAAEGLRAAKHLRGDIYEVRADASTRSFRLLLSRYLASHSVDAMALEVYTAYHVPRLRSGDRCGTLPLQPAISATSR